MPLCVFFVDTTDNWHWLADAVEQQSASFRDVFFFYILNNSAA